MLEFDFLKCQNLKQINLLIQIIFHDIKIIIMMMKNIKI